MVFFKGVILTKDNLVRRNWNVSQRYCFYMYNEIIQHLFLLPYCKICLENSLYFFWTETPDSISNMVGNWLSGIESKLRISYLSEHPLNVVLCG